MRKLRLIPRLDIKGPNLIKGIHLEGLRVMGKPQDFAVRYYQEGADELIFMDVVASLYGRNNLSDIIKETAENVFIPITVGGGIRSVDDAKHILRCGADKVAINTAAVQRHELISEIAHRFGSQAMVLSIEAKRQGTGQWEAYTDNGRERTGLDVIEWVQRGVKLGAGEILLTSVDQEGTRQGYDLDLLKAVRKVTNIPIIASGGLGTLDHLCQAGKTNVDGMAVADALHYNRFTIAEMRKAARAADLDVRTIT